MATTTQAIALNPGDADQLRALAVRVGWQMTDRQLDLLMSQAGTVFGIVRSGRLVASAGLYPYPPDLASLGIVMVDPDVQRQGLGKRIVAHSLTVADGRGLPVILVATEQGYPLYLAAGFHPVGKVRRFEHRPVKRFQEIKPMTGIDAVPVSRIELGDWDDIIALDRTVVGADRRMLLREMAKRIDVGLMCRDALGEVGGFALLSKRGDVAIVGPFIARDLSMAWSLLRALSSHTEAHLRLDVPEHQSSFIATLHASGFAETMTSPVMVRGLEQLPGSRMRLFSIVDPVFG